MPNSYTGNVSTWTQNPYNTSKPINLRRTTLRKLHEYLNGIDALPPADLDAIDKAEAVKLVKGNPGDGSADFPKVVQKMKQLRRCRLRDAERVINDMRMSFFGANLRYLDSTRTGHASRGKFRPLDLDGDGWAICSAYIPSPALAPASSSPQVALATASTTPANIARLSTIGASAEPYRFFEPTDWSTVVYDDAPDNPGKNLPPAGSYWVCFKDIDTCVAANITNVQTTSDFTDFITYAIEDGSFPRGPARAGYTRWFYPASRVVAAQDAEFGNVDDGVALHPPDTYFSLSGYFVFEKSHFFRLVSRGELWDEWKTRVVDFTNIETALMIDPDGDVYTKANNFDPGTKVVLDASGMQDTAVIYQNVLTDLFRGDKDRSGESR
jgi:hypothetical protein